ncbi:MAG TPA: hypothetical protein VL651_12120 [Bacteroidia bacterium]|jgi:hypothetical protein|nr:hypothetical protein [Bacteroidia bacterium]
MRIFPVVFILLLLSCSDEKKKQENRFADTFLVYDSTQLDSIDAINHHISDSSDDRSLTDLILGESFDSLDLYHVRLIEDDGGIALAYRKNDSWHRVYLNNDPLMHHTATMDTLQLTGDGHPEILIDLSGYTLHSYYPSPGGWAYSFSNWYVYDIDRDTIIFNARDMDAGGGYEDTSDSASTVGSSYAYRIKFKPGNICIDSLVSDGKKTDQQPGKYIFRKGRFVREE